MVATTVTWLLEYEGKGHASHAVHSGFARTTDVSDYLFGFGHFIGQLMAAAEAGDAKGQ